MPIFSFPDDNWSKCQWILTKLGTCIDIKEIAIANGQISSIFDSVIFLRHENGGVLSSYIFFCCCFFLYFQRISQTQGEKIVEKVP